MLVSGQQLQGNHPTFDGYRFAGVVVDLRRARLLVDQEEIPAGPLPLKLLQVVCASAGRLVTRNELFDGIWPRQNISDEALTKLISRTREMLGPYGAMLRTLRGQGMRLDAEVLPLVAVSQGQDSRAASPALAGPGAAIRNGSGRRPWLLIAGAISLVALLVAAAGWSLRRADARGDYVVRGYAIKMADLQNSKADTPRLLQMAESAANAGDLMRGRDLLISVHDGDPATPIPAVLLAVLDKGGADEASAVHWASEGAKRLRNESTAYTRLLVAYTSALMSASDGGRAALDAVLAVRPQAWRLQLRRAHSDLAMRNTAGAIAALRNIPLTGTPPLTLLYVLDDRIALGDEAVVAAALADGLLADQPAARGVLEAHIAFRRGDSAGAIKRLDDAATAAEGRHLFTIAAKARETAAIYAYKTDAPDAATRLVSAARRLADDDMLMYIADLEMLAAELAAESGDGAAAKHLLEQAQQHQRFPEQLLDLEILSLRLGLFRPGHFISGEQLNSGKWRNGEGTLVHAWSAFAGGNRDQARAELSRAQGAGVAETYFAESALLLAAQLEPAGQRCEADPFYPNYLRASACRALSHMSRHAANQAEARAR